MIPLNGKPVAVSELNVGKLRVRTMNICLLLAVMSGQYFSMELKLTNRIN